MTTEGHLPQNLPYCTIFTHSQTKNRKFRRFWPGWKKNIDIYLQDVEGLSIVIICGLHEFI